MISVQLGVSLEEAFVRLRAHAFAGRHAAGRYRGRRGEPAAALRPRS